MDRIKLLQNNLPVDRVAARVILGKAEHWIPQIARGQPYFDVQPAIKPSAWHQRRRPSFVDLTGRHYGFMRVLGQSKADAPTGKGTRWVLRCPCSAFVIMSSSAIKRAADPAAVCPRCVAKRKIMGVKSEDVLRAAVAI